MTVVYEYQAMPFLRGSAKIEKPKYSVYEWMFMLMLKQILRLHFDWSVLSVLKKNQNIVIFVIAIHETSLLIRLWNKRAKLKHWTDLVSLWIHFSLRRLCNMVGPTSVSLGNWWQIWAHAWSFWLSGKYKTKFLGLKNLLYRFFRIWYQLRIFVLK